MKFKVIEVDGDEAITEAGWVPFRTAFDRGIWSILLAQEEPSTKPKTAVKAPQFKIPAEIDE